MSEVTRRPKPTFRRRCFRSLLLCVAPYLLVCGGCASFQRRLIYFPPVSTPEKADELATSEKLERWKSPLGKPLGWKRFSPTQPALGAVLILHGNASCAFQYGHYADAIQQAAPLDVFIVEFPGYADRPGMPTERNLDEAAAEALQLLATNTPLYLVGESLGTGVAAFLAGRYADKVAGVALLAPYNCLADVAQAHVRILPVRLLLRDRFPAEDYLRNYRGPVGVLVGGKDRVVPERFGRRLYNNYAGPKHLWECSQATHDSLMFQPPAVWNEVVAFWQKNHPPTSLTHAEQFNGLLGHYFCCATRTSWTQAGHLLALLSALDLPGWVAAVPLVTRVVDAAAGGAAHGGRFPPRTSPRARSGRRLGVDLLDGLRSIKPYHGV